MEAYAWSMAAFLTGSAAFLMLGLLLDDWFGGC